MSESSAPISDAPAASEHAPGDGAASLQSGILASPGEEMLRNAIALALAAPTQARADLFERLTQQIVAMVSASSCGRAWTCTIHCGTDGSRVFRGGIGHSIVVDPQGRLWRARSYEDFATTYNITPHSCEIATLTPLYEQMREYLRR
jgi:hypothetical protein